MNSIKDLFSITDGMSREQIEEVAKRFRKILENSNDGLIVFNADFKIKYANPMACNFLEIEQEEMLGCHIQGFLGREEFVNIKELCKFSKENNSKICSNIEFPSTSGFLRNFEICIYSEVNGNSGLTNLYLNDRTRLSKALDELSNRNTFLNNVLDSSPDGIIAADMKGRIILFNKGAQDMVGYSEDEALTKLHVAQLYPEGEARKIMRRLRSDKFGGKGRLIRHQLEGISKDGTKIPLSLSGSIIYDEKKNESGTLGIFTDMRQETKLKRDLKAREEELIQAEQMASLGKLAAGVAHEINNPLTGILTFAEELIEDAQENDPLLEDYKIIHQEALRCREIVRDLLDFAKHDKPEMRPMDVNSIVMQSFSLVKRLASFRNIEITHNLQNSLPLVIGDTIQLQQVFLNMMVNASEAMTEGGELYIATKTLPDTKEIDVSFSDTGPGIPLNVLKNIFEPFFSTKGGKTNGLGLAVSWGIVENHHGRVVVDTAEGQGTTFHVLLPWASR